MLSRLTRFAALFCCIFTLFATPVRAAKIRSFDTVVRANKDASLDVTETIIYDFEGLAKHGIYRDIPVTYDRNGGAYSLRWEVLSVTNESGKSWQYQVQKRGRDLRIRVGDPDLYVNGVQTYVFKMKFWRAINWFGGAPEVYWNATGNDWPVPIDSVTARFYPPSGTTPAQLKTETFLGRVGDDTRAQTQVETDAIIFSARGLMPRENLTFVAGLPAGSIVQPPVYQSLLWLIADWWSAFTFPLFSLVGMFFLWRAKGRDVEGNLPAQVEWSPPADLTPAEVGTLLNERCDMTDILSTLVDLAARGYLVIVDLSTKGAVLGIGAKTDYAFTRTNQQIPIDAPLKEHERTFLKGLFGTLEPGGQRVTLESLKNRFYVNLPQIRASIYRDLTSKNLFQSNPEGTRNNYIGYGVLVAGVGVLAIFASEFLGSISYGIGLIGAGVIVGLFSGAMPAKTALGSRRLRECVGFQRFVQLAEKGRIEKLAQDDPTIFGRLLPYAMVLGVGEIWATKFAGLMQQAPDWYHSNSNDLFVPALFVSNLGSGMNSMGTTFSSSPSQSSGGSGGSGFSGGSSGGGFGGGGGGSW